MPCKMWGSSLVTASKVHDSKVLNDLSLNPSSKVVFDKAYNHYKLFAKWTGKRIWVITRMKDYDLKLAKKVVKNDNGIDTLDVKIDKLRQKIFEKTE